MEENKKEKNEVKNQKLTYEQLEAYANQTTLQAQKVFQENQMLKQSLEGIRNNVGLKEVELAIQCLNHSDLFSKSFIQSIVKKLEEILTPTNEVVEVE